MKGKQTDRLRIEYVLCRGPVSADDCISFEIEVCPSSVTRNRRCRLEIARTALSHEGRPKVQAWAAGFKAIEALSDSRFLGSIQPSAKVIDLPRLGAAMDELGQVVSDARIKSLGVLATKCPKCESVSSVPNKEIDLIESWPGDDLRLTLKCPSGHSFEETLGSLLVLVKLQGTRIGSSSRLG